MVIHHHIINQLAEQRAAELRREGGAVRATGAAVLASSRRWRLRRLAPAVRIVVREAVR
jgi:hypothetical protein